MIIVLSTGKVAADRLEDYLKAVRDSGAIDDSYKEAGCTYYDIHASAKWDGLISITEIYNGFPDLQVHTKGSAMAKMSEINKQFGVTYETKLFKADPLG